MYQTVLPLSDPMSSESAGRISGIGAFCLLTSAVACWTHPLALPPEEEVAAAFVDEGRGCGGSGR